MKTEILAVCFLSTQLFAHDPTQAVRDAIKDLGSSQPITYQTNERSGTISCRIECQNTNELNAVWEAMRTIPDRVRMGQGPKSVTVVVHLPKETVAEPVNDQPAPKPEPQEDTAPKYSVEVSTEMGLQCCDLIFKKKPLPPAEVVDKMLRSELDSLINKDPSKDTLAMAYLKDDTLDDTQYTGPLHYLAAGKRILTDEEYDVEVSGTKIVRQDKGVYYLESKEQTSIDRKAKWIDIYVVLAKPLPVNEAYDFVEAEAERASRRGMDVDAYARVGDRTIRTSWRAIPDPSGGTVHIHYDSKTKKLQKWKDFIKN